MDIKYPPNTLQIFSQCFTGSWSTEKLLMFFLLSFFNCISVFIQIEYFHKDREVNKIPINFTKVLSLKS